MSYLERAITDGHAKLTGEGKQQKILYVAVNHTERYADPEEQVRAGFNLNPVVRMAARRHRRHKTKGLGRVDRCGLLHLSGEREFQIKTVIRVSVSAPFVLFCGKSTAAFKFCMTRRLWFLREIRRLEREANIIADLPRQYGKPEEYRFYKGDPNNDISPVSKEALIGAIKKCHQTLWAGGKLSPPALIFALCRTKNQIADRACRL